MSNNQTSYNKTLQFITATKLKELAKQKQDYARVNNDIFRKIEALDDPTKKVEILLKAVRSWRGSGSVNHRPKSNQSLEGELNVPNLYEMLRQANAEPGFNKELSASWAGTLENYIRHRMRSFDCAELFGNLFNEWLSSGDTDISLEPSDDEGMSATSEFVNLGRQEMYEQKARLTSLIFEEKHIDKEKLDTYLTSLFEEKENKKALKDLRKEMKKVGEGFKKEVVTEKNVEVAIRALLREGLLDEESRGTISEFLENATMLKELTSVVGMRLASLDTWSWPAEGISIQMRRNLNGKYRAYISPDILDAIMLQHVGIIWQVAFKASFTGLVSGKAWKQPYNHTKEEMARLQLQLTNATIASAVQSNSAPTYGIAGKQESLRRENFFLSPLANSRFETVQAYAEDAGNGSDTSDEQQSDSKNDPMDTKYKLLHLLAIESTLNTALHGSHAVICSDFEWFGPSLSHDTILTVLKFFGATEDWLGFFERFLRAPLYFPEDPNREVRTRVCGTPISYSLSALFGEVVLFAMDLAVNQKAKGLYLYRLHDDLWLWDASPEKVAVAWREMNNYAELAGLAFNKEKTGSVCIKVDCHPDLPKGAIQWGFLKFDEKAGRLIIDQENINLHITEMRRQLAATKSVFGWINTYNKYMAFIMRNCGGRPAGCFGKAHMQDLISTWSRIHCELFSKTKNSPAVYLSGIIKERFGVTELPEGYFYLPIRNGGLELVNPMVELFAVQRKVEKHKEGFSELLEEDESDFNRLAELWSAKCAGPNANTIWPYNSVDFMTFEEFKGLRGTHVEKWRTRYDEMFRLAEPVQLQVTPAASAAMDTWPDSDWDDLSWYYKWIVTCYGAEVIKAFGRLEVVDPNLIPIGLVKLFHGARLKLDQ